MYKVTVIISDKDANKVLLDGLFVPKQPLKFVIPDIIRKECISSIKKRLETDVPVEELDIKVTFKKMNLDFIVSEGAE